MSPVLRAHPMWAYGLLIAEALLYFALHTQNRAWLAGSGPSGETSGPGAIEVEELRLNQLDRLADSANAA